MPVMLLGCVNFFTKHLRESEIKFVHLLCVCVWNASFVGLKYFFPVMLLNPSRA